MDGNNNVLTAVAVIEGVLSKLRGEKRIQLQRIELRSIGRSVSQVVELLFTAGFKDDIVLCSFVSVVDVINKILEDESYVETDTITKQAIEEKIVSVMSRLYLKVGEYYSTHDFSYTPRMSGLLNRIVDNCITQGFYFGVEKELESNDSI